MKQEDYDLIISKLARIRDLFDESDMEAEGHGMEDMIADPYAVACYAENKLKRLIKQNKKLKDYIEKNEFDLYPEFKRDFPNGF
jgi:hypothetical protein